MEYKCFSKFSFTTHDGNIIIRRLQFHLASYYIIIFKNHK